MIPMGKSHHVAIHRRALTAPALSNEFLREPGRTSYITIGVILGRDDGNGSMAEQHHGWEAVQARKDPNEVSMASWQGKARSCESSRRSGLIINFHYRIEC